MSEEQKEHDFVEDKARAGVVDLDYPIVVDGKPLKTITITRLRGKQVKEMQAKIADDDGFDLAEVLDLFCDQPMAVLDDLDQDDYYAVVDKVTGFLPKSLAQALEQIASEYLAAQQ